MARGLKFSKSLPRIWKLKSVWTHATTWAQSAQAKEQLWMYCTVLVTLENFLFG